MRLGLSSLKIRYKILLPLLVIFFLSFGAITWLTFDQVTQMSEQLAAEQASEAANRQANAVKAYFEGPLNEARSIAYGIVGLLEAGKTPDREDFNLFLKSIVHSDPTVIGAWACFEPNAFDGKDGDFAGQSPATDESGRFVPYWYRDGGTVAVEPLKDYDVPGAGDYYLLSKNSGKETILEPYSYSVGGKETLLTSLVVPVTVKGRTLGVVGVDMALTEIGADMSQIRPFDGAGYITLVAPKGTVVSHPQQEILGTNFKDHLAKDSDLTAQLQAGEEHMEEHTSVTGEASYITLAPFTIGKATSSWGLFLVVPQKVILAKALELTNKLIFFSIGALIVASLIILGLSIGISSPLIKLQGFAHRIAAGDFNADLNIRQKDEVGVVCDALHDIRDAVKGACAESEAIVTHVEHGRFDARGDASRYSGGFAELIKGVNTLATIYTNIIDSLPVGAFTVDHNRAIQYHNKKARQICGAGCAKGANCEKALNGESCTRQDCLSDTAMRSKSTRQAEVEARTSAGEFALSQSSTPLVTRADKVAGCLEIIIDQTEIKRAQATIMQVAEGAEDISSRVASASEQLSAQVDVSTRGAELQRERITETATAMEEMNVTVLEVASNATRVAEEAEQARNMAREGADIVGEVVKTINNIQEQAVSMNESLQQLGVQADSIGQVMTVINDIADQTNLLALNAAIEAARAGEAGRGFAVVADEVRKLAEKTMSATSEVGAVIRGIQQSTHDNIRNMNTAGEAVARGTTLAHDAGKALSMILDHVNSAADQIRGIATAAEEQSATSEEINRSVETINQIVIETADGLAQSNVAIRELSQMALQLKELIAKMH